MLRRVGVIPKGKSFFDQILLNESIIAILEKGPSNSRVITQGAELTPEVQKLWAELYAEIFDQEPWNEGIVIVDDQGNFFYDSNGHPLTLGSKQLGFTSLEELKQALVDEPQRIRNVIISLFPFLQDLDFSFSIYPQEDKISENLKNLFHLGIKPALTLWPQDRAQAVFLSSIISGPNLRAFLIRAYTEEPVLCAAIREFFSSEERLNQNILYLDTIGISPNCGGLGRVRFIHEHTRYHVARACINQPRPELVMAWSKIGTLTVPGLKAAGMSIIYPPQ